jgi:hypothetical protein
MNPGITPVEELIVPDGTNEQEVKLQKEAHAWWESFKPNTCNRKLT